MALTRFLAEVRTGSGAPIPQSIDPLGVILTRVGVNPHTAESRALRKATVAVIATEGDLAESHLWVLGKDALGLLDAFARQRLGGRYSPLELEIFSGRLRAC